MYSVIEYYFFQAVHSFLRPLHTRATLVSLLLFSCCNDSFPLLKHGCWRLLSLSISSNSTTSCFRAPTKIVRSCQGESPGGGLLVSRQGARSLSRVGTSGGRGDVVIICELGTRFALGVGERPPHWVLGGHFGDGVNSC